MTPRDNREVSSLDAELERVAARSSAQMRAENFPVALRVVPRRPRAALARVYAFARFVDDVGDEADGDRLALLDLVEADVHRLDAGDPQLSPVAGLKSVVAEFDVPLQPLLDLVEANRRDQLVTRYASFADLLDYCRYSAAPVGRIVLALAGHADAERSRCPTRSATRSRCSSTARTSARTPGPAGCTCPPTT